MLSKTRLCPQAEAKRPHMGHWWLNLKWHCPGYHVEPILRTACDVGGCEREAAMFSHNSRTGSRVRCIMHMRER